MKFTDDGIELTVDEAQRLGRRLSVVALLSLGAILLGLGLYFSPWRGVGEVAMLWALIPTVFSVVPLMLLRLAQVAR